MMLSNTLYMFEHNVRSASILGIVGAGGIGFLLADRLRAYELQEACLIIIIVVLTVYAIDYLSNAAAGTTDRRQQAPGAGRRRQAGLTVQANCSRRMCAAATSLQSLR